MNTEPLRVRESVTKLFEGARTALGATRKYVYASPHASTQAGKLSRFIREFFIVIAGFHAIIMRSQDEDRIKRIHSFPGAMQVCNLALEEIIAYETEGRLMFDKHDPLDKDLDKLEHVLRQTKKLLEMATLAARSKMPETSGLLYQTRRVLLIYSPRITAKKAALELLHERKAILDWISTLNYGPVYTDLLRRRLGTTGGWFLESKTLHTWLESTTEESNLLFCPGDVGAGKTMIATGALNLMHDLYSRDLDTVITYVYFGHKMHQADSTISFLRCVLKQVLRALPSLPKKLESMYKAGMCLDLSDVHGLLQEVAKEFKRCFIVIDALDEFRNEDEHDSIISTIKDLRQFANVLVTSRRVPRIMTAFCEFPCIEIRAPRSDMRAFLDAHHTFVYGHITTSESACDEVKETIIDIADGLVLLAKICADRVIDALCVRDGQDYTKEFKDLKAMVVSQQNDTDNEEWANEFLRRVYDDKLRRICSGGPGDRATNIAMNALWWVTNVRVPLKTAQLEAALAEEPEGRQCIHTILSIFGDLLIVNKETDTVHLHQSAQEHFERFHQKYFSDRDERLRKSSSAALLLES